MVDIEDYTNIVVAKNACADELSKVDIPLSIKSDLQEVKNHLENKNDRNYSEDVLLSAIRIHLNKTLDDSEVRIYANELISKLLV